MISASVRLALNSLSVESPSSTSKKCALISASRRHWRWFIRSAPLPTRTMKIGISGALTSMMIPEIQSAGKTKTRIAAGTKAASAICGR